jgi:hypothetical protein
VNPGHVSDQSVNNLSCFCTKFLLSFGKLQIFLQRFPCVWGKSVTTCIKCFVFSKAHMFTLVELSWFAIKAFGSCVVYFGLWLGVNLCFGRFLVTPGTCTPFFQFQGLNSFDTESSQL